MRILAVDDDPVVLDLLTDALTGDDMQCDLICTASAEEALEVMEADPTPFDCFLLDIMLPGIDGIELCDRVRRDESYRSTPIIMITASRAPDLMGRAFQAGATDFVTKPLNGLDLGARINTASMLNDSMQRERMAQHTLAELAEQMRVRFEDALPLQTEGVTDLKTMENDLLRLPEGCYAMQLFTVDCDGLGAVYENVSAAAFRQHLEHAATALVAGLDGHMFKLAYAGHGRFAGVVLGRPRIKPVDLAEKSNAALNEGWNARTCEADMPPMLRVTILSDQRLWSGRSAGDHLSDAVARLAADEMSALENFETTYAIAAE